MASEQVSLVIETEKSATQIEQDARTKSQEILGAAKDASADNCKNINKSADVAIEKIKAAAQVHSEAILNKEALAAADMSLLLQATAGQHKTEAIRAAVHVLTGRT